MKWQKRKDNLPIGLILLVIILFSLILGNNLIEKEQNKRAEFCVKSGGQGYSINDGLCNFMYQGEPILYDIGKVINEFPNSTLKKGDYCFTCWSSKDCSSAHNDILREKEVHC